MYAGFDTTVCLELSVISLPMFELLSCINLVAGLLFVFWVCVIVAYACRFPSCADFESEYGAGDEASLTKLHQQLEPYLLRRVKKDVEKSLPAKVRTLVPINMPMPVYLCGVIFRRLSKSCGWKCHLYRKNTTSKYTPSLCIPYPTD